MTRGNARELAIHLIYGREFTGDTPVEVVRLRLEEGYYEQLAAEYEIYSERPTGKQIKYLENIVAGVHAHEELLNTIIGKFSIGWDVSRISRLSRAILQLAIYEIIHFEDVPDNVAVSEAVRLTKMYDTDASAFVNGILGSFVRSRATAEAEAAPAEEV